MTTYECVGPVRGRCGVRHGTIEAAWRHCEQDTRDIWRGHGSLAYSDRRPVPDGEQHRVDGLIG